MKRFTAIFLSIILLATTPANIALAEDIIREITDEYTDEDLLMLCLYIEAETMRRLGRSYELPAGVYVVGRDIPSGAWKVTVASKTTAEFILYRSEEVYNSDLPFPTFDELLNESYSSYTIGRIELIEGNIVEISGKVTMTPFVGVIDLQKHD